ncbi:MAG: hypothetical protein QG597_2274 [Actinomycetota bacterium]|nr:hypothetical protein [Actinomycetota bacterium]
MSREQLGAWVRERRRELGLTQEAVAARGPLSPKTVRTVESGKATGLRNPTRVGLERALEWPAGSVREAVEQGRRPEPVADKPKSPSRKAPGDQGPETETAAVPVSAPQQMASGNLSEGPAAAGTSLAVAKAVLNLRRRLSSMRDTLGPSEVEAALAELTESQRDAEIALGQAMQWIVNDDAKRREAAQLLYELQQPL